MDRTLVLPYTVDGGERDDYGNRTDLSYGWWRALFDIAYIVMMTHAPVVRGYVPLSDHNESQYDRDGCITSSLPLVQRRSVTIGECSRSSSDKCDDVVAGG